MNYKGYEITGKRTIEVFCALKDDGTYLDEIERYGEGDDFIEEYGFSLDDGTDFSFYKTLEECKQAIDEELTQ